MSEADDTNTNVGEELKSSTPSAEKSQEEQELDKWNKQLLGPEQLERKLNALIVDYKIYEKRKMADCLQKLFYMAKGLDPKGNVMDDRYTLREQRNAREILEAWSVEAQLTKWETYARVALKGAELYNARIQLKVGLEKSIEGDINERRFGIACDIVGYMAVD